MDPSPSIKNTIKRQATTPVVDPHPALQALDLIGVRRSDVAKGLELFISQVSAWGAGESVPEKHQDRLCNLAVGALAAAIDTLGEVAADHPDLVATEGYRRYAARVARAKKLLTELAAENHADEEAKR